MVWHSAAAAAAAGCRSLAVPACYARQTVNGHSAPHVTRDRLQILRDLRDCYACSQLYTYTPSSTPNERAIGALCTIRVHSLFMFGVRRKVNVLIGRSNSDSLIYQTVTRSSFYSLSPSSWSLCHFCNVIVMSS